MNKLINYALSINNLIKQIGFKKFIDLTKDDLSFKVLNNLGHTSEVKARLAARQEVLHFGSVKGLRILFLSPHPDDDVFSSGGTLAKFAGAGSEIKIIYFNDGASGTKDGKDDSKLIDVRRKEATEATKILGITDLEFLNITSKSGGVIASNRSNLLKILRDFQPDIIFVPSIVDNHPTHKDVTKLLYSTLIHNSSFIIHNFQIWQYEVWTPIIPNRLVKIDDVIEQKKKAINCHQSQLECRDYLNAIIDFNSYRAKSMGAGEYAEGFFVSNIETFKTLYEQKL